MVNCFCLRYPDVDVVIRATGDVDAGVLSEVAATTAYSQHLLGLKYKKVSGNRFTRKSDGLDLVIDLLVDDISGKKHNILIGSAAFDSAKGLRMALARPATKIDIQATLSDGQCLRVSACLPDLPIATAMKVLTWKDRLKASDSADVETLLRICQYAEKSCLDVPRTLRKDVVPIINRFFRGRTYSQATRVAARQFTLPCA